MEIGKIIKRLNELYKKRTEEGLTTEEELEQKELRKQYLESFRKNVRAQLDTVKYEPKKTNIKH